MIKIFAKKLKQNTAKTKNGEEFENSVNMIT